MADPRDEHAAVPILLNPVPEAEGVRELRAITAGVRKAAQAAASANDAAGKTAVLPKPLPGREAQQSLFDDLPVLPPPTAQRRPRLPPTLQRMAEDLLRTRAPAIINELADEHARRLSTELRERLRNELARLLAELAEQNPRNADLQEPASATAIVATADARREPSPPPAEH